MLVKGSPYDAIDNASRQDNGKLLNLKKLSVNKHLLEKQG